MHLNNPFDRPNPFRARHHTTNLIYKEPTDIISRLSRRRSEYGGFLRGDTNSIYTSNYDIEFVDLSLQDPNSKSKLEFLKLNNPYLAARDEPLTTRTNNTDVFGRQPSFSSYEQPSAFYRGKTKRVDYSQDSPMRNFESGELQGSRVPAISIQYSYSPPADYSAPNNLPGRLFDRAKDGLRIGPKSFSQYEQTYRDDPMRKSSQQATMYEQIANSRG